jgi:fructose-1,6-bisphosphatase I
MTKETPYLKEFMQAEAVRFPTMPTAVYKIIQAMAMASKVLIQAIKSSRPKDLLEEGLLCRNASGDMQHLLDRIAHNCFLETLTNTGLVGAMISEEAVGSIPIENGAGEYIVSLDPLDGSANIPINAPVGTIFSIYQRLSSPDKPIQESDVLQPGSQQIAAGYLLYSTTTMLVYGTQYGVHGFTYEPAADEFLLTHQALKFPQDGVSYAVNDGYFHSFPRPISNFIKQCRKQGLGSRYSGALVADFHRHLLQGGVYLYPSTPNKPTGKLRLMFECNPLAFLAEKAGGLASDGSQSVLCIQPHYIHQCIPFYIGSANMVQSLLVLL